MRFEVIGANFENSVSYSIVNRDKVGNFGKFDDKTLFRKGANLHTKREFTHNISRCQTPDLHTNSYISATVLHYLHYTWVNYGFVSGERLCCRVLAHFSCGKSKTGQE